MNIKPMFFNGVYKINTDSKTIIRLQEYLINNTNKNSHGYFVKNADNKFLMI